MNRRELFKTAGGVGVASVVGASSGQALVYDHYERTVTQVDMPDGVPIGYAHIQDNRMFVWNGSEWITEGLVTVRIKA
jgi:hypothetical protein